MGLCHYSFTVKLKCHVSFCSTCIILRGEIHMDNCTTLLVQFWKVENPEIHREQSKRNRVTSQTKKKGFISYRQLGKILARFSVLLHQGLSRFPSSERKPLSASARFYAFTVKLGEQRPLKVRKWQLPLPFSCPFSLNELIIFVRAKGKGQRSERHLRNSLRCPIYMIYSADITKSSCYTPLPTKHHSFFR